MKHLEELSLPETQSLQQKLNFQAILLLLKQNKRLFVTVFLFVWLMTSAYSVLGYKPNYVSSGMVMIKDTALTAKYVTGDSYETTTAQSTSSVMNTMGLLKTSVFMDELWQYFQTRHPEVLKKYKIKDFTGWQKFYGNGSKLVKYSNMPGTDLISMEFKWEDPVIAKEGLEVLINSFRDASLEVNRTEQRERSQYLTQQIGEIQQKLNLVREESSQFKAQHGIVNTVEENLNLTRAKMEIKNSLAVTQADAEGKSSQVSGYKRLLGMNTREALRATGLGRNDTLAKLHAELYTAQSERASLLTKYTEQSVKVQEVDSHIRELQSNIQMETARSVGHAAPGSTNTQAISDETRGHAVGDMVSASTEAQQLSAKNRVLSSYLQELETRAKNLPKIEAVIANFDLEESALNDSLKTLKEKELDARLKESQSLSNVFLVDAPRLPLDSSFPKLPHLLVLDLVMGLVCGFAAIVLKGRKAGNAGEASTKNVQSLVNGQFQKEYASVSGGNGKASNGVERV